jgi:DNA repair photolyase
MPALIAKSLLSPYHYHSEWFGSHYNMNIYRGCNHNCIYCCSRSERYGLDNFTQVNYKQNALELLASELTRAKRYGVVATGAMSDPYNHLEGGLQLTRQALQLLASYGFGLLIMTKGTLIVRDIDVLQQIAQNAPVLCAITLTTINNDKAKFIEPSAPSPKSRLEAIEQLSKAGLKVVVLLMPLLPRITDDANELISLLKQIKEAGACAVTPAWGLSLRDRQRSYFYEQIKQFDSRLPQWYQQSYGNRTHCTLPNAGALSLLFNRQCDELGLVTAMPKIITHYQQGFNRQSRQNELF